MEIQFLRKKQKKYHELAIINQTINGEKRL